MIEHIGKGKAKLIVEVGLGSKRKRKTKVVTYQTKRELGKLYQKFEDEVRHNPLVDTLVTELVSEYIKNRNVVGIKATTAHGYEVAKKRIEKQFEGVKATDLTTYQVDAFIAEMAEKYTPKTISNTIALLNAAYARAVKTGQLSKNPCEYASLPKQRKPEIRTFGEHEVLAFLRALKDERLDYKVAYELCLLCGMRRSEVLGLRHKDVNLMFRTVSINKTRHRVDGELVIQSTKTERSRRTLAIPQAVADDIAALIAKHDALYYEHTDWLIQDGFGQPMNPSVMTNHISEIEDAAGLPRVSVHGLRHTFATMLNSDGVDIARISAELGHSNITTTLNAYTHIFGGASASSRGIADSLNKRLENSATFSPPLSEEKTATA